MHRWNLKLVGMMGSKGQRLKSNRFSKCFDLVTSRNKACWIGCAELIENK